VNTYKLTAANLLGSTQRIDDEIPDALLKFWGVAKSGPNPPLLILPSGAGPFTPPYPPGFFLTIQQQLVNAKYGGDWNQTGVLGTKVGNVTTAPTRGVVNFWQEAGWTSFINNVALMERDGPFIFVPDTDGTAWLFESKLAPVQLVIVPE
jgi:hypothetical protein